MNSQSTLMRESRKRGYQRRLFFAFECLFIFQFVELDKIILTCCPFASFLLNLPPFVSSPIRREKLATKLQKIYKRRSCTPSSSACWYGANVNHHFLVSLPQFRCLGLQKLRFILKNAFQSGDFNKLRLLCISGDTKKMEHQRPTVVSLLDSCMFLMCLSVHTLESLFIFRLHSLFPTFFPPTNERKKCGVTFVAPWWF